MAWFIYVLCDPRTDEVRYVGVTHRAARLVEHISIARRRRGKTHKNVWIRSLLLRGLRPVMRLVETSAGPGWAAREVAWITTFKALGARLTNATVGGEGTLGWRPSLAQRAAIGARTRAVHTGMKRSAESRERMRLAQRAIPADLKARLSAQKSDRMKAMPPATRAAIADKLRGRKASDETRARLSSAHANPSDQTRALLREAVLRRPAAVREAFAKSNLGRKFTPEHREKIAAAKRAWWSKKNGGCDNR